MTNKVIEELATNAVKKCVLLTKVLDPYIFENDREPSWDGAVYIYNNEKKTKSNFIGRVPVQIKGKQSDKLNEDSLKFPVQIADLKSYIRDSGLIYFVVLISKDGKNAEIFYNSLLPVKIKQILGDTKNISTISLNFEKMPSDTRDIVNLFMDFHTNSQRQISYVEIPLSSLEELKEQYGQLEIVHTISAYGYTDSMLELPGSFFEREIYMYAEIGGRLLPVSDIGKLLAIGEEVPQSIKVNDKEYYTSFTRVHTKSRTTVKIGASLEVFIEEQDGPMTITIKPANMLSDRLKDTEFLIDAFNSEKVSINGIEFDLSSSSLNPANINIAQMCDHYEYCCKIRDLFNILSIDQDLNLSELTEAEQQDLFYLISSFVDGELVKFQNSNENKYIYFKLQDITILIYAHEEILGSCEYRYIDIFSGKYAFSSKEITEDTQYFYPTFSGLKAEHYIKISNINYGAMLAQYKPFPQENPNIYTQANLDALQMLLAYDVCKKNIIIDTVIKIMQWILQHGEKDNRSKAIYQINYLQAIARIRELREDEQKTLINISISDDSYDDIKFAANVLLEQFIAAKAYFERLESNMQEDIKGYPIYTLYRQQR